MKSNSEIESIIYDFNHGKIEGAFFQISKLIKKHPDNLEFLYLDDKFSFASFRLLEALIILTKSSKLSNAIL